MHEIVKEEMIENELGGETVADQEEWKRLMQRSFARMDEEVREYRRDTDSDDANRTTSCRCQLHTLHQYDTVGSTALVAVLTPHNFIISNCGDSRAVLCRKNLAIPLSNDHKVGGRQFKSLSCWINLIQILLNFFKAFINFVGV